VLDRHFRPGVGGYLVLSVPAIAWATVKGMEAIGQAAITGVSSCNR
jgi:hypothetical protein